ANPLALYRVGYTSEVYAYNTGITIWETNPNTATRTRANPVICREAPIPTSAPAESNAPIASSTFLPVFSIIRTDSRQQKIPIALIIVVPKNEIVSPAPASANRVGSQDSAA